MNDAQLCACPRCRGEMLPGIALETTWVGSPDDLGGDLMTMNPGGPGRMVDCVKCQSCGFSRHP